MERERERERERGRKRGREEELVTREENSVTELREASNTG
jgi:hypothetical protein